MMYRGWPSLCLNVRDLERSARFYEAVGMQRLDDVSAPGARVILRSGGFRIGLFAGIAGNVLNIRGADVVSMHRELLRKYPDLPGEVIRYEPDAANRADLGGCSWETADPDGNTVFFDTNRSEEGEAFVRTRTAQILEDAEHELRALGADAACLEALRTQVIDRFASPGA